MDFIIKDYFMKTCFSLFIVETVHLWSFCLDHLHTCIISYLAPIVKSWSFPCSNTKVVKYEWKIWKVVKYGWISGPLCLPGNCSGLIVDMVFSFHIFHVKSQSWLWAEMLRQLWVITASLCLCSSAYCLSARFHKWGMFYWFDRRWEI